MSSNNAILILGESGSGKSAALRNLDPAKTLLIQTVPKKLPFKSENWLPFTQNAQGQMVGSIYVTDKAEYIVAAIKSAANFGKSIVIIDDFQYMMVNEFMNKSAVKGYDKFSEIGRHAWDVIMAANNCDPRIRVYLLSHISTDELTQKQHIKTIGKMLDEKVVIEGYFTTVLKAAVENKVHCFKTKNSGNDTTKAPMGMFESDYLDNDIALVDQIYTKFYNLT